MIGLIPATGMWLQKNANVVITAATGAAFIGTVVLTAKEAPKASEAIKQAQKMTDKPLTFIDKTKIAVPKCLPAIGMGVLTMSGIVALACINKKQQASLLGAAAMAKTALDKYEAKTKELYGEDAHQKILDSIVKDAEIAEDVYFSDPTCVGDANFEFNFENPGGKHLFCLGYNNRAFEATVEQVLSAEYHFNRNYVLGANQTLGEFERFLGLKPEKGDDDICWDDECGIGWIDFRNHVEPTKCKDFEVGVIDFIFDPESHADENEEKLKRYQKIDEKAKA